MPTLTEWLDDIEAKATRYDMPQVLMLVRLCRALMDEHEAFGVMEYDEPELIAETERAWNVVADTLAAIEAELGGDAVRTVRDGV